MESQHPQALHSVVRHPPENEVRQEVADVGAQPSVAVEAHQIDQGADAPDLQKLTTSWKNRKAVQQEVKTTVMTTWRIYRRGHLGSSGEHCQINLRLLFQSTYRL